jgi:hypothetical protein
MFLCQVKEVTKIMEKELQLEPGWLLRSWCKVLISANLTPLLKWGTAILLIVASKLVERFLLVPIATSIKMGNYNFVDGCIYSC